MDGKNNTLKGDQSPFSYDAPQMQSTKRRKLRESSHNTLTTSSPVPNIFQRWMATNNIAGRTLQPNLSGEQSEVGLHGIISHIRDKRPRDTRECTALGDTHGSSPPGHKSTSTTAKKQRKLTDFVGNAVPNISPSGTGSHQMD